MTKPKFASSHDDNHYIPRDFLRDRCGGFESHKQGKSIAYTANYRGYALTLFDMSECGGYMTDWLLAADNGKMVFIEVKTQKAYDKENHDMTIGEQWTYRNGGAPVLFVVEDKDMQEILDCFMDIKS